MTGNIHNADAQTIAQKTRRKPEFNGQAPFLFGFEPVRSAASEQFNQPGFAVVHMPCRAEHHDHLGILTDAQQSWGTKGHGLWSPLMACAVHAYV